MDARCGAIPPSQSPVARQKDALLSPRTGYDVVVLLSSAGEQGVVAGGAKPTGEGAQHLVAHQTGRRRC